jgi:hypothetical protein
MLPFDGRYHFILARLDDGLLEQPIADGQDGSGVGEEVFGPGPRKGPHVLDGLGETAQ